MHSPFIIDEFSFLNEGADFFLMLNESKLVVIVCALLIFEFALTTNKPPISPPQAALAPEIPRGRLQ